MFDPYTCYVRYLAIKTHFLKWEYDYFEYRGYTSTSLDSFNKRKDRAQFYTLSRKKMPLDILLANLSQNPNKSVREINLDADTYLDYQRRIYSLSYVFKNEITELDHDWDRNFIIEPGRHPLLMRAYLGGRVSIETASIALCLSTHENIWMDKCKGDLLFTDVARRLIKYHKFLKYNKDVFQKFIVDYTTENAKYITTAKQ